MLHLLLALALCSGDVRGLGDDAFAVREAAEARLQRRSTLAWPAVEVLGLRSRDPEVRRRSRRVLARHFHRDPATLPTLAVLSRWHSYEYYPARADRLVKAVVPRGRLWLRAWRCPQTQACLRAEVDRVEDDGSWWIGRYLEGATGVWDGVRWVTAADCRRATGLFLRDCERAGLPRLLLDRAAGRWLAWEGRWLGVPGFDEIRWEN